ncbi:MAG: VWA domain-containing protein [Gordonia sp. (in: high G+C Gram-positive bacteria)]
MRPSAPWLRPPESLLDAHSGTLCRLWRAGGRFGLLLVGDAWEREQVFDWLRPPAATMLTSSTTVADLVDRGRLSELAVPAADLIDRDVAAVADCGRILASAPELESVPEALRSRLTAVVGLSVAPVLRCRRLPQTGDDVAAVAVAGLAANGLHDHVLDIGAVRCLTAAAGQAGLSSAAVLTRNVIEPRLAPMTDAAAPPPPSGDDDSGPPGDATSPDADTAELSPEVADMVNAATPSDEPSPAAPPWATPAAARAYATQRYPGRRGARSTARRGRARRTVDYRADLGIDLPQTIRAIALRGRIDADALRSSVRTRRAGRLTIVILDRSDSMSGHRARAAAAMTLGAIAESSRDRSSLAVITARGNAAEVAVPPTRDLQGVRRVIESLPAGGGTPLASAFMLAAGLVPDDPAAVRVVVLTDGGSNVRIDDAVTDETGASALDQAASALTLLVALCEQVLVVPTARPGVRVRREDLEWLTANGAVLADTASA